jgi:pantoate--beta-alanine ligase
MPVEIVGYPIVRERDGLALSSRNAFLSPEERARAPVIARELSSARAAFEAGEIRAGALRRPIQAALERSGFRVDYVEITGADELEPIPDEAAIPARALLAVAAFLGKTRLIDNLVLGEDPDPTLGSEA